MSRVVRNLVDDTNSFVLVQWRQLGPYGYQGAGGTPSKWSKVGVFESTNKRAERIQRFRAELLVGQRALQCCHDLMSAIDSH